MVDSPSFAFGAHYEITVSRYRGAFLSIPAIGLGQSLQAKDLLTADEVSADGKYTAEQHLARLQAAGKLAPGRPLLVFGARNLCVNWRSPAVLDGKIYALEGEEPVHSQRPYYGIGLRGNRLTCDVLLGGGSEPADWDFFCAGVPVLWDGWEGGQLLDLMLCEASDHSHVFDLPRGKHPAATNATRQAWQDLQTVFIEHLYTPQADAARAMRTTVEGFEPPLRRCGDYFHSIMGVRDDGILICLSAQGQLEDLGQVMKRHGCRRAICLENSGSVMPTFFPQGIKRQSTRMALLSKWLADFPGLFALRTPKQPSEGDAIPLVRSPNFRPCGRAAIAVELENAKFISQPVRFG